jgi:hypothetical protein
MKILPDRSHRQRKTARWINSLQRKEFAYGC